MKKPLNIILIVAGALAVLGVVGFFGYSFLKKNVVSSQTSTACVATAFPYVILEHNKAAISELLEAMQANPEAEDEDFDFEAQPKGDIVVISKEIDHKMIELANSIGDQEMASENMEQRRQRMSKAFDELARMFKKDAPAYMADCTQLFSTISEECGDLEQVDESNEQCFENYRHQIAQLMEKHFQSVALE